MSLIGTAIKVGVAQKVFTEVRKPANQAKAKQMWSRFNNRNKPGNSGRAYTRRSY